MSTQLNSNYDVIIVGAGLVGSSLALMLARWGFKVALLETHLPTALTEDSDFRPLTLNQASWQILNNLHIIQNLNSKQVGIKEVLVSEQGRFGKLRFQAQDYGLTNLGHVVSFQELHVLLYQTAIANPNVTLYPIQKLLDVARTSTQSELKIQTSTGEINLTAELIVGTDGSHSQVRELTGIAIDWQHSNETALIFDLHLQSAHQNCAHERFIPEGILGVLPLIHPQQMRAVWTLPTAEVTAIHSWSEDKLREFFNRKLSHYLGPLLTVKLKQSLALKMGMTPNPIKSGIVLLGNAAHTLYPIAAQGFNLGLSDAAALAETLHKARNQGQALGDLTTLNTYHEWRSPPQQKMHRLTQGITQLFGLNLPLVGSGQSLGLLFTDLNPLAKKALAQQMLGLTTPMPLLAMAD